MFYCVKIIYSVIFYALRNQLCWTCCVVANKNTLETVQYGVEGSTTFLECQARSPHMLLKWHLQKENSDRRKEVRARTSCPDNHVNWQNEMMESVFVLFPKRSVVLPSRSAPRAAS